MSLVVNLPPTLAKSQVSSVRKNLKMQMLSLLKHPRAVDFLTNITTLLTDLGATQSEVSLHCVIVREQLSVSSCSESHWRLNGEDTEQMYSKYLVTKLYQL